MNDRSMERLVRAAIELDEFERLAGGDARDGRLCGERGGPSIVENPARSRAAVDTRFAPVTSGVRRGNGWWAVGINSAAAAIVLLLFWTSEPTQRVGSDPIARSHPPEGSVSAIAIEDEPICLSHVGEQVTPAGERVNFLQVSANNSGEIVLAFRYWDEDCACRQWKLHEWDDGQLFASVSPGQAVDVMFAMACEMLVESICVVFTPADGGASGELLGECLKSAETDEYGPDWSSMAALESCLPPGAEYASVAY
jgi:hypothetical protein